MRTEGERLSKRKLNVQDAAEMLGISVDAVRMRARRGSLESVHEDGRLYVWLDNDVTGVKGAAERVRERVQNVAERELVEDLRDQVSFLRAQLQEERDENRRKDHLLAAALERIPPQLEPPQEQAQGKPSEPRESSQPASQEFHGTHAPPTPERPFTEEERPSWWRRFFGLE
jgi:predicted transcriptional regulator